MVKPAKNDHSGKNRGVILAAGGIVWKGAGPDRKLAVIHRARYGDWTLPKGKLEDRESPLDAARREVREEIGCETKIIDFAGVVNYEVDGVPKVVFFWNMEVSGECAFTPSEEVEKVEWLTIPDAISRLDHPAERNLLREESGK